MEKKAISESIRNHSIQFPGKAAIIKYNQEEITYSELVSIYDTLSIALQTMEIKSNNRVALISGNSILYSALGLFLMENAIYCPMDVGMPAEKYSNMLDLLKIDCIMVDNSYPYLTSIAEEKGIGVIGINIIRENAMVKVETRLISKIRINNSCDNIKDDRIAIITSTSGTTSTPKIVPNSYYGKLIANNNFINYYDLDNKSISISLSPKFSSNFTGNTNATLAVGGTIIIVDSFKHNEMADILMKYPITWFTAAPAVLSSFAKYLSEINFSLNNNSIKFIRATGAPLSKKIKDDLEDIFNTEIIQTYGMTEVGNITSTYKNPNGYKEFSAGVSTGIYIRIYEDEIQVKGPTVFSGYENPDESNDKYFVDGWFKTGDMGYIDKDGYVFITGRIKEMINRGGEKVSPYEVEKYILDNPMVLQASVFPYPSDIGSEEIAAAVRIKDECRISLSELRQYLERRLSSYKMPTILYIVREIPTSESNKVQRKKLYEILEETNPELVISKDDGITSCSAGGEICLSDTEKIIHKIWLKTLKAKNIGASDDFFKLGGDSLASVAVISEIEDIFKIRIPIALFFERRSIRGLGEYVDNAAKEISNLKFLMPIKSTGAKTPLICLHSGDGQAVTYHNIGKFIEQDRPVYGFKFKNDSWGNPLTFNAMAEKYADEIETLYPEGPYNLLGRCYGGILALKVAITLKQRGKEVASVIMLDSPVTGHAKKEFVKKENNVFYVRLINTIAQLKIKDTSHIPGLIVKKIKSLGNLIRVETEYKIYQYLIRTGKYSLIGLLGVEAPLKHALHTYTQEKYNGRVYYFKATQGSISNDYKESYWSTIINDLVIVPVNSFHNDIQSEENSKFIADKLVGILNV